MANNTILLPASQTTTEVVSPSSRQNEFTKNATNLPKINTYLQSSAKQFVAGGLSGCIEVSITYPTEYVKVMLQLQDGIGQKRQFKNSYDVVKQTIRNHGFLGIYRGFSVILFAAFPKYMIRFGSYEQLKHFFVDKNGQLCSRDKLICGLGAGIFEALFAVIPQESIKVKFINDRCSVNPKYKGLFHGIREIVREKGLRATYQGVTPTLIKQGSNQAIRFFVFDSLKDWYTANDPNRNVNKTLLPVFGAVAGAISVFANTPFDVVKTRMQGLEAQKYRSTIDCIGQIYRNEGILAFYKGLAPRLTKVTLEVAIAFTMYNMLIDLFK